MRFIDKLLYFLIGVAITIKAPCLLLTTFVSEASSTLLSGISLRLALVVSIVYILFKRKSLIPLIVTSVTLGFILFVQPYGVDISEYYQKILIIGISGFICGYAIEKPTELIRYAGVLCVIYGIAYLIVLSRGFVILFDSMVLGYTLTPIICWLLLLWLTTKRGRLILLFEILIIFIVMIFISSRGCVLSSIVAIVTIFYYNMKIRQNGSNMFGLLKTYIPLILIAFIGISLIWPYIYSSNMILSGSLFTKMGDQVLLDYNGRDDIFEDALRLLENNWETGVGICNDRIILGYVFPHNIFVEIFLHYGIPLGGILFVLYWLPIIRYLMKSQIDPTYPALILTLCCYTWIRLLVSDTYIENMYPIMFILGIVASFKSLKKKAKVFNYARV